ncbi:MAG: dehydrogenase [Planctomycetaceae bacterium]|nr:dehydrogenase [Planctomycetaceae bacterium]
MTAGQPLPDNERLQAMYHMMVRIRVFEEQTADLVEAGEIKTPCHFCIGQEAVPAAVCAVLEKTDTIWGAHRSHGHYLAKGGDLNALMAEIFCRKTGCSHGRGGSMHVCAPEVGVMGTVPIVAATIPIAVGAGLASSLNGDGRVAVSFFGDGATEEGGFAESLNLAALRRLPVLFVCENNLYSSHMGLLERRKVDGICEIGQAHGVHSERIDGNDIGEVYVHAREATARARAGKGPTLLECRTFRWRGHVGPAWDVDVGVKRKDELHEWLDKDPIALCAEALRNLGLGAEKIDEIHAQIQREVADAVEFARASPNPAPEELTQHVYCA